MFDFIRRYFALRKARKRFELLGKMIDSIDRGFNKHSISRKRRRQFWYDFIYSPESRKKFIKEMKI